MIADPTTAPPLDDTALNEIASRAAGEIVELMELKPNERTLLEASIRLACREYGIVAVQQLSRKMGFV